MGRLYSDINSFVKGTVLAPLYINELQKKEIQRIIDKHFIINGNERRKILYDFIKNNVNDQWIERIEKLRINGKQLNTLENMQLRYGDIEGNRQFELKNKKQEKNLDYFVQEFGEDKGYEEYKKYHANKKGISLERFIILYGEENGTKKWANYKAKRKETYIKSRIERGGKFNNGRSMEEYIKRHGEDEGLILWEEKNKNQSFRFSIEYYKNKYGEDWKKYWDEYCLKMDKTSLKEYKKKYGVEEGKKKYEIRIKKLQDSSVLHTKENYIIKYGKEIGEQKFLSFLENKAQTMAQSKRYYSKISQKLFWWIYDELNEEQKEIVKFGELNNEFIIYKDNSFFMIDFICGNIIIEFDGDIYYKNKEKDEIRDFYLKEKGFHILRISDSEFAKERIGVLNKCLNFIKENYICKK